MAHGKQVVNMGMTNKQFQGFIRLALELLEKAAKKSPDNEELQKVRDKIPGLYGIQSGDSSFLKNLSEVTLPFWRLSFHLNERSNPPAMLGRIV